MSDVPTLGAGFRLDQALGRTMWKGVRLADGRTIAVKFAPLVERPGPDVDARLAADRAALVGLRHPNLVAVLEVVREGDRVAVVYDLVTAPSVVRLIATEGRLAPPVATHLAAQLAAALAVVHATGRAHGAVTPSRVLVSGGSGPLAAHLSDIAPAWLGAGSDAPCGERPDPRPAYAPPELLVDSDPMGPPADVYSLGTLVHELVTGRPPFAGGPMAEVLRRQLEDTAGPLDLPGGADAVVAAMLAKRPGDRPTAAEVAAALADASPPPPEPVRESVPAPEPQPAPETPEPPEPMPTPDPTSRPAGPDATIIVDRRALQAHREAEEPPEQGTIIRKLPVLPPVDETPDTGLLARVRSWFRRRG